MNGGVRDGSGVGWQVVRRQARAWSEQVCADGNGVRELGFGFFVSGRDYGIGNCVRGRVCGSFFGVGGGCGRVLKRSNARGMIHIFGSSFGWFVISIEIFSRG